MWAVLSNDHDPNAAPPGGDLATQPASILLWWVLPIAVGFSANFFPFSTRTIGAIWTVAFLWMGMGCLLNARRCHRLHCYISGPVFVLGAIFTASVASGIVDPAPHLFSNVVNGTLVLTLLSFVPEMVWKRYI